jgi:hypothetical protein
MVTPSQFSLFDDDPGAGVSLVEAVSRGTPADKAQAAFRRLIARIENRRESLRAWQAYGDRYRRRLADELIPAQQAYRQARKEMALLLGELLERPGGVRGKSQRGKLRHLLLDLTRDMLLEEADPALEALHDKYSEVSHAEGLDEGLALSQAMMEELLGVDLGDGHAAKSMEELFEQAQRQLHEQAEQAASQGAPRRRGRKSEAAEARREQAAKEVGQSVRDVYRKLASALHPDRETDPVSREAKTAQMQRANSAYEAGDLLELLTLQLEIEQIDAAHLASLPKQRLAHYTQVLRDQVAGLDAEIEAIVAPFRLMVQCLPYVAITTAQVDRSLNEEIARLRREIDEVRADMDGFRDPVQLARMLRGYHPENEDLDELAELMDLAVLLGPPGVKTGARRGKPSAGGARKKKPRAA